MKTGRILKATWLAASVFILMLAMALPVSARDEWEKIGYAQVTTPAALRTKYNNQTASTIVKIVPKGSVIHVTKYMGNNWYKASYGSKSGYISGLFLTGEDDDDLSDNVVARELAIDTVFRTSAKTLTTNVINVIEGGEEVEVLGERSDNWLYVSYDGDEGYIRSGFFRGDPKTGSGYAWKYASQPLYIRSTPVGTSSSNVVATLKKGKKVKVIGVTEDNWYRVRYKNKTCYVKEGYFTNEAKYEYVSETIANATYFRSSRSTEKDNVIRVLSPNTVVRVYKSMSKRWYKIKAGTRTGYILGGYFASDRDVSESGGGTVKGITTAALRMRSGNGTEYAVVTVIPKGEEVTLKIKKGDWYQVTYDSGSGSYTGWVSGNYLDVDDD